MKKLTVYIFVWLLILSACSKAESIKTIELHGMWIRPASQSEKGAIYFILHNHKDVDDALLSVSTDAAEAVEVHLSEVDANGVARMTKQETVPLPADGEVMFAPGGYHVMLVGLKKDLKLGDKVPVILHFENNEDIVVNVTVSDAAPVDPGHSE